MADSNGGMQLSGKFGAIVSVGGGKPEIPVDDIKGFFDYNNMETVGSVTGTDAVACFSCGHGIYLVEMTFVLM